MSTDPSLTLNERVAAELRAAAARHGVSGAAIARRVSMPPLWVTRRMSGVAVVSVDDLILICQGIGTSPLDVVAQVMTDAGLITREG